MRPISLPEPPSPSRARGMPEIFEGGAHSVIRRAVIIGNGFPSSDNQCIGLVRGLGFSDNNRQLLYRVTRPRGGINEWLHWLPVSLHKKLHFLLSLLCRYLTARGDRIVQNSHRQSGGLLSVLEADVNAIVTMARHTYEKEGPLLVVASGRDTISCASSIKRLAYDKVFVVQIQHPRSHLNRFDLVITPRHDYYPLTTQAQQQVPQFMRRWITPREPPDSHVVLTMGALHQVDSAALRNAAIAWQDEFAPLPKPLVVVNIGGPTRRCRYSADLAKQLTAYLLSVLWSCGSVRISFSHRTPEKVSNIIVKELGNNPNIYIWEGQEPNPHMGHLAWADAFVITADSVSMISEACSTGKPVYIMGAERCRWKFADFHKSLRERGMVRPFVGSEDV
ncbi:Mito_fiss_Elm1 domain-containing protein, partial [Cephalotus follicularis]